MLRKKPSHHIALFLFINLIFFVSIYGQITWQKTYGWEKDDKGRVIKQTSDGGYILVGDSDWYYNVSDRKLYGDIVLMRLDAYGDTLWVKKYGETYWDHGYDVLETKDNGFLVLGSTDSYGPNGDEVYLLKTDSNGDTLWTKKYGRYESDLGSTLLETNNNGYIIAGVTYSLEGGRDGSTNAYIIRIDSIGTFLWEKLYSIVSGAGQIVHVPGGYIFIGRGYGHNNYKMVKINFSGDTLWTKAVGDSTSSLVGGIVETQNHEFILAGHTEYPGAYGLENSLLIIKTDSLGNLMWENEFNISYADITKSIQPTKDGKYIIAGSTITLDKYSQALLMKINGNGDSLWTQTFGNDDFDDAYYAEQTDDGGFILTGFSEIGWDNEIFIVKTDPAGYITSLNDQSPRSEKLEFLVLKNYPNPFNHQTVIVYQLPLFKQSVSINIYNTTGQKVYSLFEGSQSQGTYKIFWHGLNEDGQDLSSGIYFIHININEGQFIKTLKLALIR